MTVIADPWRGMRAIAAADRATSERGLPFRVAGALSLFAVSFAARLAFIPLGSGFAFVTFYPAMVVSFLLFGVGPSLILAALSAAVAYGIFIPPAESFAYNPAGIVAVSTFLLTTIPLGLLLQGQANDKRALARLMEKQNTILSSGIVGLAKTRNRHITWANHGLETLLGYAPGELDGAPTRIAYPDDAAYLATGDSAYPVMGSGGTFQSEIVMRRKDGSLIWVNVSGTMLRGEPDLALWIFVSVDPWKQAEAALRTSETFLERIGAIAGVGGWQLDLATHVPMWSAQTCRLHDKEPGFTPTHEEAMSFYTPASRTLIEAAVSEGIATGKSWDLELELVSATGRHFWARTTGVAEMSDGKAVRLVGAFQDITDRRRSAQALAESEERLRLALDAANVGVWAFDLEAATMLFDARASTMVDHTVPPDTWVRCDGPEPAVWAERIDPAYRATRDRELGAFLAGRSSEVSICYPARHADGSTIWLSYRGVGREPDPMTGRFRRAIGVVLDVTRDEEAKRRLREREDAALRQSALLKSIYATARAGLCFVDRELRIVEINDYLARLFGRSVEACIGKTRAELRNERPDYVERLIRQVMETGQALDCHEFRAAAAVEPGVPRDWLISLYPVRDEGGIVIGVGQAILEITAQKRIEQALIEANRELKALAHSDGLTGLANRRRFDEALARECGTAGRTDASLALVMLDVDRFKAFNDLYGHRKGDDCLCAVADALCDMARRPGDLVARYGGEEFAMLLPATDLAGAIHVAESARAAIEALALPHAGNVPCGGVVTVSLGIATLDPEMGLANDLPGALIAAADSLLYEAKKAGRNMAVAATRPGDRKASPHGPGARRRRYEMVATEASPLFLEPPAR